MKWNMVSYTAETLPKVKDEELVRLRAQAEDPVDFSDIPELTGDFFKNSVRGKF